MINGDRIKQARELRRLTQTELAAQVGVKQAAISQIESGRTTPKPELLEAIALLTGFPVSFFKQAASIEFPLGSLLFRARSSMIARDMDAARQYGRLIVEIAERMEEHIKELPLKVPRLTGIEPVQAAGIARSELGLSPDTPVKHLIHVLEKNGILVLVLPRPLEKQDAYSVWTVTDTLRPVIVMSGEAPGDRLRFSVAHELGHLVMHQSIRGDLRAIEREADAFAGEFLVPEMAAKVDIVSPVTLTSISPLKPKWGVSVQTLIRRAFDLGFVTQRQYTYLMQQISAHGWRKREPPNLDIPVEKPRIIHQMAEMIYGLPLDYRKIAEDMNISIPMAKDIFEAQTGQYKVRFHEHGKTTANLLVFSKNNDKKQGSR